MYIIYSRKKPRFRGSKLEIWGSALLINQTGFAWNVIFLAIPCDLFEMVKWPFQRLSDLQPGDKKVTLNHLVLVGFLFFQFSEFYRGGICLKVSHLRWAVSCNAWKNICPNGRRPTARTTGLWICRWKLGLTIFPERISECVRVEDFPAVRRVTFLERIVE